MAKKARKPASKRIPQPHADRLSAVRESMADAGLDAYAIVNRMDQFWLTGFTGEDGLVLVTPRQVVLLTDGRFDEAADKECPWAKKVLRKVRTPAENAKQIGRYKAKKIGFEPGHMTVAEFNGLSEHLSGSKLVPTSGLLRKHRLIKHPQEVDAIKVAIDVAQKAFVKTERWIKPGHTERDIAAKLAFEMQKLGAQEVSFPTIVAVGPSSSLPHYEPSDVKFDGKQPILIDWGARIGWYVSDLTRMIWPGSIPPKFKAIYNVVRDAHDAAVEAVRPGMQAEALDRVARRVIEKAGFGKNFNHALGHGMGLDVHEAPRLGKKSIDTIETGMIFTIEPGVYLPGVGGVRLESDVLVTDDGAKVLSTLPM